MAVTVIIHISAALLFCLFSLPALALDAPPGASAAPPQGLAAALAKSGGDDFLQPDQAFRLTALPEGSDRVRLNFQIAEGYYLYRARIKVATQSTAAQLGALQMPDGQVKNDEYFGRQEVYHHELDAVLPGWREAKVLHEAGSDRTPWLLSRRLGQIMVRMLILAPGIVDLESPPEEPP